MDVKLGKDAVLYYSATAGQALSAFTLILDCVSDVNVKVSTSEADVTTRANLGWKQSKATLKECEITFDIPLDTANVGYIAVRSAFIGGTMIGLAALTGPKAVAGNEGPVGDFTITGFDRAESIGEAQKMSVTAKLYTFKEWAVTTAS